MAATLLCEPAAPGAAKRREGLRRRGGALLLVLCAVCAMAACAAPVLKHTGHAATARLASARECAVSALAAWLETLQESGRIGFMAHVLVFSAWVGASMPTTIVELATGFMWGPVWGFFACVLCKSVGSMVCFLVVLLLRRRRGWQVPDALRPRLSALRNKPLMTMVGVRLAPLPLGMKNYGLALCDVPFVPYMIASLLVNAPFSASWAIAGASCSSLTEALSYDSARG